jgi:hypothetical protein
MQSSINNRKKETMTTTQTNNTKTLIRCDPKASYFKLTQIGKSRIKLEVVLFSTKEIPESPKSGAEVEKYNQQMKRLFTAAAENVGQSNNEKVFPKRWFFRYDSDAAKWIRKTGRRMFPDIVDVVLADEGWWVMKLPNRVITDDWCFAQ